MDSYSLLRLVHIIGFIVLGGGLLAVFVSELRAYRTTDVHRFAEAAWYTATFYDALALPGAVLVGLSGLLLIFHLGLGFFSEPWLVGMWGLFLFEFVEGNTITRVQFQRSCGAPARCSKRVAWQLRIARKRARCSAASRTFLCAVFLVIVYCGTVRPDRWTSVLVAIAAALIAAVILTVGVPKLARPS